MTGFDETQQRFLEGLASGIQVARAAKGLAPLGASTGGPASAPPSGPDALALQAQERVLAAGGKLTNEEQSKRTKNPLDRWDDVLAHAAEGKYPKGTDVFAFKYHGLFYVAPAQDSFMCRLRIPNGVLMGWQMRGIADLAEQLGGGYADVTTRANLQIREIPIGGAPDLLTGLVDLGLTARGSGADNIRNVTGSPTAGIDPQELIDTRPLAKAWHHRILNDRALYGLPRKFNVAFDGGGLLPVLEETNDIGFSARQLGDGHGFPPGVYFRVELGGITGHLDFARDAGLLLQPEDCTPVAAAMVRVFIAHGDRTDRRKARLKYLLDGWGFEKFLAETEKELGRSLPRLPLSAMEPRGPILKHGHVGVHPQRQDGLNWLGVVLPIGRISASQMRGLAGIADRHGSGTLRLTVWQNLLISDVPTSAIEAATAEIAALGFSVEASALRGGIVACTGSAGCKFAASDTKRHALAIGDHLDRRVTVDQPINIHLTGCHHSCAQHYIGDIGLLACKVPDANGDEVEGYHVLVGGGFGEDRAMARDVWRSQPFETIPALLERLVRAYLAERVDAESFADFTRRHPPEALRALADHPAVLAAALAAE